MTLLSQMGLGSEATRAINGVIRLDILVEIGLSGCPIPCISLLDLNVFFHVFRSVMEKITPAVEFTVDNVKGYQHILVLRVSILSNLLLSLALQLRNDSCNLSYC